MNYVTFRDFYINNYKNLFIKEISSFKEEFLKITDMADNIGKHLNLKQLSFSFLYREGDNGHNYQTVFNTNNYYHPPYINPNEFFNFPLPNPVDKLEFIVTDYSLQFKYKDNIYLITNIYPKPGEALEIETGEIKVFRYMSTYGSCENIPLFDETYLSPAETTDFLAYINKIIIYITQTDFILDWEKIN